MKTYRGGEVVNRGIYLNLSNGELNQLGRSVPALPGSAEVRYLRLPAALALLAGPLAGLVFIIFLPLAGIVGIVSMLIYRAERGILAVGRKAAHPAGDLKVSQACPAPKGGAGPEPPAGRDKGPDTK